MTVRYSFMLILEGLCVLGVVVFVIAGVQQSASSAQILYAAVNISV